MDAGAQKWLSAFFLAGVGLGAWFLAGLPPEVAKTFSPIFLVVVPLLVTFLGYGVRALFGARVHPLLFVRRKYGRSAEDAAIVVWCAGASMAAAIGCAALVPPTLFGARALLVLLLPLLGTIAGFAAFGARWTPGRRLLTGLNFLFQLPITLLASWFAATFALGYLGVVVAGFEGPGPWLKWVIVVSFLLASVATGMLAVYLHAKITGEQLLAFIGRSAGKSWRQISVILSRAGFKQSSGSWIGPLGRGEACVTERRGRVQVQMSGFRKDVTLRAGVPGPKSVLDTGDDEFDGQIAVAGDPTACFAAFIPEARAKLLRVLDRFPSLHLADGHLVAEGEVPASRVLESLRELAAACEALGEPGHEGERVLRILRTDPSPRVRARALDHLMKDSVAVPADAAREALADLPGPEVTLAAAYQLGGAGGAHLERLLGPASSQMLRAKALDAIAARCDEPTWAAAAARGLADPEPTIRLGVVRAMGNRWVASFEDLAIRASNDGDARVRVEAIGLFVERGLGVHQAALYPRLADLDFHVKKAAVGALGSIANPEAIEKLVPLRTAGGELGRLASDAIKEIQNRMPSGARGQLSLTDDDRAGRLSNATEGGSLAIASAPTGSVALAADEPTPDPAAPPPLAQARKQGG